MIRRGESQQRGPSLPRWSAALDAGSLELGDGSTDLIHRAGREQKGFENDLRTPGAQHAVGAHKMSNQDMSVPTAQAQVISNYSNETVEALG